MDSRRDFLQKLTGSVLALSLLPREGSASPLEFPEQPYDGPMLRVAIMGLGSYGTRVAEAMQSCTRAKLVGVLSGTPSQIKTWQGKYNIPEKNCYNYENFDRIKVRRGTSAGAPALDDGPRCLDHVGSRLSLK